MVKEEKLRERAESKISVDSYGEKDVWNKYKRGKWFANQTIDYNEIKR